MKSNKFAKSDWSVASRIWNKYVSPFRPSREDIKIYSGILKKKEKILLLGSTPELRKVIPGEMILADSSYDMISRMSLYDRKAETRKETWIVSDWLDLDKFLPNNHFDLILGDLVLRNIENKKQVKFLEVISNLLKKTGLFVTRLHVINENISGQKEIIKNSFKEYSFEKSRLLEDLIASRMFDKNTKRKEIDKKGFEKDINDFLAKEKEKKKKSILKNILEKWKGPRTWTQKNKEEIERMLSSKFSIERTRVSSDYIDSQFYPIYILKNDKKS